MHLKFHSRLVHHFQNIPYQILNAIRLFHISCLAVQLDARAMLFLITIARVLWLHMNESKVNAHIINSHSTIIKIPVNLIILIRTWRCGEIRHSLSVSNSPALFLSSFSLFLPRFFSLVID